MAEEREDISYLESKILSVSCEEDNECDLSVITVIENNQTIVTEEYEAKTAEKIADARLESIANVKTEVIILDEAPAEKISRNIVRTCENRRVIELSDTISKMELRRQFKVDVANREVVGDAPGNECRRNLESDDDGSAEILSRLPPGTVLIKQSTSSMTTRNCGQEDSDYVHESSKDSAESNSSESSSATLYAATGKVKRMQHRTARSKKIVEVRRNPVRNKKKKPIDEDFLRPRQRLLSVKRKAAFVVDPTTRKRAKAAPVPYMNTRSVTRKMYTVGATYQAPTIHDAIEWKQWPAHGMNERPIWHPQFGLAYGYNNRHFLSLDDQTYREIIDEPVIEVVSVDPNSERVLLTGKKRKFEKISSKNTSDNLDTLDDKLSTGNPKENSFEACMHGSLHSVLAYCARVVTPTYKNTIETKLREISQSNDIPGSRKSAGASKVLSEVTKSLQNEKKKIGTHSLPTQATASTKISGTTIPQIASSSSSDVPKCLVVPRRTISFTNVRNIQGNILQEVFGRASKNTLIFLKPTDPPVKTEKICTTAKVVSAKLNPTTVVDPSECTTEELYPAKLDDIAINHESLVEMSMIKKTSTSEQIETSVKNADEVKFPITAIVATTVPKKSSPKAKEIQPPNGIRNSYAEALNQESRGTKNIEISHSLRPGNSNQAVEIAKILAEYNQKAAKNPVSKKTCSTSKNALYDQETNSKPENENDCNSNQSSRTTFLSVVEQPKKTKKIDEIGKKIYHGCNAFPTQESSANLSEAMDIAIKTNISVKTEETEKNDGDDSRAMDLSIVKLRESEVSGRIELNPDETINRQWLQELIEDTAILYCAAAGVSQDDVVNYLDTLDSTQSLEWLGS